MEFWLPNPSLTSVSQPPSSLVAKYTKSFTISKSVSSTQHHQRTPDARGKLFPSEQRLCLPCRLPLVLLNIICKRMVRFYDLFLNLTTRLLNDLRASVFPPSCDTGLFKAQVNSSHSSKYPPHSITKERIRPGGNYFHQSNVNGVGIPIYKTKKKHKKYKLIWPKWLSNNKLLTTAPCGFRPFFIYKRCCIYELFIQWSLANLWV